MINMANTSPRTYAELYRQYQAEIDAGQHQVQHQTRHGQQESSEREFFRGPFVRPIITQVIPPKVAKMTVEGGDRVYYEGYENGLFTTFWISVNQR
jgi:hypothetical protein